MKSNILLATGKDVDGGSTCLKHNGMPGLFFAELVKLLDEYAKFERGIKGTRFDVWL